MRDLTYKRRMQLLCLTAASGSLANLQCAVAAAAAAGQLHVCRWLREQGCPICVSALPNAASAGQRDMCAWLLAAGCPHPEGAPGAAALSGHADLVDWLLDQIHVVRFWELLRSIAAGCELAALQRLHARVMGRYRRGPGSVSRLPIASFVGSVLTGAACSHTPDWRAKVEWLLAEGWRRQLEEEPPAERVEWLAGKGVRYCEHGCGAWQRVRDAVRQGDLAALHRRLGRQGSDEEDVSFMAREAALVNQRSVLLWLKERRTQGVDISKEALHQAAKHGSLDDVRWVVQALGAVPAGNPHVLTYAVTSGNKELCEWLLERGCALSMAVFAAAAEGGSVGVLEWLAAEGCPMGGPRGAPYLAAGRHGDMATLAALRRLGCPHPTGAGAYDAAVWRSVRNFPRPVIQWMLEQGWPVNKEAAPAAQPKTFLVRGRQSKP